MVIGKKRGALLPSYSESVELPMTALRQRIWHDDLLVCAKSRHMRNAVECHKQVKIMLFFADYFSAELINRV